MTGVIELIILAVCLVVMVKLFTSASFRAVAKALLAIPAILLVAAVAVMVLRIAPHAHREGRSVAVHGPMNTYPRTQAEAHARNPRADLSQYNDVWRDYIEPTVVEPIASGSEAPKQQLEEAPPAAQLATVTKELETARETVKEDALQEEVANSRPKGEAELRSLIRTVARAMLAALDEDAADRAAAPAASGEPAAESVSLAANTPAETATKSASPKPAAKPTGPRHSAPERSTRPDWVGEPPRRVGDAYQVALDVDPYATIAESDRALPAKINAAVDDYAAQLIGPQARGRIRLPMEYIDEHVKRDDWQEWRKHEMGPSLTVDMVHRHILLRFDSAVNDHIRQMWKRSIANERVAGAGTIGGGVLALVAMIYGYLRFDLATRGAYRRRIRWAVVSVAVLTTLMVAAGTILHDAMR